MRYREGYPPYVSVGEKRAKAAAKLKKLQKTDPHIQPVILAGNTIAATWWGKSWNRNLERYADYANRVGRGRSYVRHGAVLDLRICTGRVSALVQGTRAKPYEVNIGIEKLAPPRWDAVKAACAGRLASLPELLAGKFPRELGEIFMAEGEGLFPAPQEICFTCSCPDIADMCKHVAAALYGIGARLDNDPGLFFTLRGVEVGELIAAAVADTTRGLLKKAGRQTRRVLTNVNLSDVFGIDLDEAAGETVLAATPGAVPGTVRKAGKSGEATGPAASIEAAGQSGVEPQRFFTDGTPVSPPPVGSRQRPAAGAVKVPPAALPPLELVEQLIIKSRKGIDTATLVKKTGLNVSRIRSIVQRLRMLGRIANLSRGIYGKAGS